MFESVPWKLPVALAVLGWLFTTKPFLMFLDRRSPATGLLVYYACLTAAVYGLQLLGLSVAGTPHTTIRQLVGTMLVLFAFFIVVDWESCYVQTITKGSCDEVSNVYLSAEDGATYWGWSKLLPRASPDTLRLLTYVLVPFVLALLGSYLIRGPITLSVF